MKMKQNLQHKCLHLWLCSHTLCICLRLFSDTMIFNTTGHNDSQLRCEVNVTRDPAFVLSIFHDGAKLQTVGCAPRDADAALPHVTLSETISLSSGGKYECQLHLNGDLITKSVFHYHSLGNNLLSDLFQFSCMHITYLLLCTESYNASQPFKKEKRLRFMCTFPPSNRLSL